MFVETIRRNARERMIFAGDFPRDVIRDDDRKKSKAAQKERQRERGGSGSGRGRNQVLEA